ncbi:MAG: Uncharacterized protein XD81_0945 [Bacteroidetes bacterium 38_7]|nr:MAG: Uncharacterized protein XD81_0945 [Bacteroidetes bacterium 38_7]HAL65182.1 ribonuclease H [Bacteroidales bacterium]
MGKKYKYYVIWEGTQPGIVDSWEECLKRVKGFPNAKYKGFYDEESAQRAFEQTPDKYFESNALFEEDQENEKSSSSEIIVPSICVDAACSGNPGILEYRGVDTSTRKQVFYQGPFKDGTNNIGEFLAIVHALALCEQKGLNIPIYSDSLNAIQWIKNRKAKTKLIQNENNKYLFELIARAENWLQNNEWNNLLLKWDTEHWGENPADFGRK